MRRSLSILAPLATALTVSCVFVACGPPPSPDLPAGPSAAPTASASAPTSATPAASASPATREANVAPNGDRARREGTRVAIESPGGTVTVVEPTDLHPPAGDRGLLGITPTAIRYLDDGTLFVGLGDGTVTALGGEGRRRFSLGFRGSVRALVSAGPGLVAVTTSRGVMALLGADGKLRWEHHLTAEALGPAAVTKDGALVAVSQRGVFAVSRAGEPLFTHASPLVHSPCPPYTRGCDETVPPALRIEGDDVIVEGSGPRFPLAGPHPAVPSLVPTFPLTFRRVRTEKIVSLLPDGPDALFALVTAWKERSDYDWGMDDRYDVVRIGADKTTVTRVPHHASKSEVFEKGSKAAVAPLFIDSIVRGPTGDPWILARRFSGERTSSGDGMMGRFGGAGQILELVSGKPRERTDLFKTFSEHWLSEPIAAASQGTANLFCFGLESPVCAAYDGARSRLLPSPANMVSARVVGGAVWLLSESGGVYRLSDDGKEIDVVWQPENSALREVAGANEKDVWARDGHRYSLLHRTGTDWQEAPVPVPAASLTARAADDVWGGRIRWDGKAWSVVHGAPPATVAFARGKDDVWAGTERGLWRGTAPGPVPARLPPAKPADEAAPAPTPLDLAADDKVYSATRVTFEVAGEKPLTAAKSVAAGADGVLWLTAWDRLVEIDAAGKGTRLRGTPRDTFGRMAFPEAAGRGVFLERDELQSPDGRDRVRSLDGRTLGAPDVQLDRHDAVAVHGDPTGSLWVVGAPAVFAPGSRFFYEDFALRNVGMAAWNEHGAHALVRPSKGAAFQPVLGLPAASWCDVAATSDGGAWFAGAQSEGPAGEGVLFHAKGRLGGESSSRFRASAALLAVSASAPDDAWAVGAAGTVVHVKGNVVTRLSLRSGQWLRAVLAVGPEEVWFAGDGGTLVRWDGRTFHEVAQPLGAHAAFTALATARGSVWAVGPSGVLEIKKVAPR